MSPRGTEYERIVDRGNSGGHSGVRKEMWDRERGEKGILSKASTAGDVGRGSGPHSSMIKNIADMWKARDIVPFSIA